MAIITGTMTAKANPTLTIRDKYGDDICAFIKTIYKNIVYGLHIKGGMADQNDFNELALAMAHADEVMHQGETIVDTNYRLRENVNKFFDKIGLTLEERHLFEQWSFRLFHQVPMNASRLDIFLSAGTMEVLHIVGL